MTMTWAMAVRVLKKNALLLLLFPVAVAAAVAYLTRDMPREYTTAATIYTGLASGYSITSTSDERMDFTAISNAFDNLISTVKARETLSEVGLRLLAHHLSLKAPVAGDISPKTFAALQAMTDPVLKRAAVKTNEAATLQNLQRLATAPGDNAVKWLLYESSTPYAVEKIMGALTVARRNTSDMLDLGYKSEDPAVCLQTLEYLIDTFKRRYTSFRSSETNNVVAYFEQEVRKSYDNLKGAEDKLTRYGLENKIINYAEQSKYVAASKEGATADFIREKMALDAARSARETLERKLDEQGSVLLANQDLTAKRTELAKAQVQLANATVYGHPAETVRQLQATVTRLSDELKVAVQRYYTSTTTLGAVPQRELMGTYLDNTIRYQEAAARMGVVEKRMAEFDRIYTDMAPLGSSVNRIGREINVAEREYLSILHGLNLARLRQKDLQMTGTLTTLDAPMLPMKPQPTTRKLLIVASYLAGLMLVLSIAVGRAMLNRRISTPERASQLTDLPLASAFPAVRKRFARLDLDQAEQRLLDQLRSAILLHTSDPGEPPRSCRLVTLLSTQPGEGKTWVGERIGAQFARAGHRVAYLHPATSAGQVAEAAHPVGYPVEWDFADTRQPDAWLPPALSPDTLDYVFLELPPLLDTALPVHLAAQSDVSLLVVHADSAWTPADQSLLGRYRQAARRPVLAVLNHVEPGYLAGLLGRIPRQRNRKGSAPRAELTPKPAEAPQPA